MRQVVPPVWSEAWRTAKLAASSTTWQLVTTSVPPTTTPLPWPVAAPSLPRASTTTTEGAALRNTSLADLLQAVGGTSRSPAVRTAVRRRGEGLMVAEGFMVGEPWQILPGVSRKLWTIPEEECVLRLRFATLRTNGDASLRSG